MKITKREKNLIFFTFGFYLLILILLIVFIFNYGYSNIKEIEVKKQNLEKLYSSKLDLEKKGLSFDDFKKLNKNTTDKYLSNVLPNISKDFYDNNFLNDSGSDFESFINKKTSDIKNGENKDKLLELNSRISKILPSYLKDYSLVNGDIFTNFKFINYLETIFETFSLKSNDKLGITNIEMLGDYTQLDDKNNKLDVNLFSIPVKLTIKGKKEGIINFLHFVNYVGNIEIDEDANEFKIYSDDFLKNKFGDIVLKGANINSSGNYNIYENQIFDIEYIRLKNYLDSSNDMRPNGVDLVTFVKNKQANQDYEIEVLLNFYIKGIQKYELTEFITKVYDKYTQLNSNINKKISDVNVNKYDIIVYKKAANYLLEINNEITNLKKELIKSNNLEQLYNKAIKYNTSLLKIEKLVPLEK